MRMKIPRDNFYGMASRRLIVDFEKCPDKVGEGDCKMTLARVPDFDYRINPATCDLDLARETRKRRGKRQEAERRLDSFEIVSSIVRENSALINVQKNYKLAFLNHSDSFAAVSSKYHKRVNMNFQLPATGAIINLAVVCGAF